MGLLYEVIVRVARKVEPSRLKHLFPLPLSLSSKGGGEQGGLVGEVVGWSGWSVAS